MQDKKAQIAKIEAFIKKCLHDAENHQVPWLNLAGEIYDLIDGRVSTDSEVDIHINTVGTAYERIKAELTRGLANFDKWLIVEHSVGSLQQLMTPLEANRLVQLALEDDNPRTSIVDMLGHMLVENRSGLKLHTYTDKKPGQSKCVKMKWIPLNLNNYLVDPADPSNPLFEAFISYLPKYQVLRLPKIYEEKVKGLSGYNPEYFHQRLQNEGDVDGTIQTAKLARKELRVVEFWGTILDDDGNVMMWKDGDKEFPLENVQILCANGGEVIADPIPNKRYSGRAPFVVAPLLRSGKSAYRPGLLVNGAELNKHLNVIMSSLVLGAIKACHNVTVVHSQWLKNPEVVANGIEPNMTLVANEDLPPGAKLFTSEKIGDVPSEGIQIYQIIRQLAGENMFASDQFMTGNTRSSDTATAQIQSQNVIGGLFEALDAVLEDEIIECIAQETFQEMIRQRKLISDENLLWVFSGDEERAMAFKELPESELLGLLGTAFKFRGKGLRSRAASKGKAQAFVQMMSMLMGNPLVAQPLMDNFSFKTLISKAFESIELDPEELSLTEREYDLIMHRKMAEQQAMAQAQAQNALIEQGGGAAQQQGASNPMMGAAQGSDFPQGNQEGQAF